MPCHAKPTVHHFSDLQPLKHGFSMQDLLGHADDEHPATCGIFTLDQGHPVSFDKIPYHCFGTILEGELIVEDLDDPEEKTRVKAGDIVHVPRGSSVRWSTATSCKGTYVHLKPFGDDSFHKGVY
ncbi:hypothetical protein F5I97DRAFT_1835185 [Phlebopus sp. FC_14]|nr:hypothetical protein F5I97DRAFT_1835185 [Phlebopus sp. FC_14]